MITPIAKNYKGLISITGPTRSGKSQLAEFLISEQHPVTYIATSKPRPNDPELQKRIDLHRKRRPDIWSTIEHPKDLCKEIESLEGNESINIDSSFLIDSITLQISSGFSMSFQLSGLLFL